MVRRSTSFLLVILCAVLFTASTAMAKEPAPEGRTYFVHIMGLNEDPYEAEAQCLDFDSTHACPPDDQCLTWQRVEGGLQTNKESGFSIAGELDDDGLIIAMEGQGRVNSSGRRSSISMVVRASALGFQLNYAVAGREVGRGRCLQMVEDFYQARTASH